MTDPATKLQIARAKPAREVVVHPKNRGKGEAIKTGLRHWLERQLEFVVILDADGQHRPEEIDRFVAAASRRRRRSSSLAIA